MSRPRHSDSLLIQEVGQMLRQASLVAAALSVMATSAQAQIGNRPIQGTGRPTTSPYLNLLNANGGGPSGLNYFTQVRPQRQFAASQAQMRRELNTLELNSSAGVTYDEYGQAFLPQSGHPTTFMNLGGYYNNGAGSGGGSMPGGFRSGGAAPRRSSGGGAPGVPGAGRPNTSAAGMSSRATNVGRGAPGVGSY